MFMTCCGADLLPIFVTCPWMEITTSSRGFVVLQGEMLAARAMPRKRGDSNEEALVGLFTIAAPVSQYETSSFYG